jgi:hypothetical protein
MDSGSVADESPGVLTMGMVCFGLKSGRMFELVGQVERDQWLTCRCISRS